MEEIEIVKHALIHSCINYDAKHFKPFLFSDNVHCQAEKKAFYRLFKRMIASAECSSIGSLTLRIEHPAYDLGRQYYRFYDAVHLHSRLTIIVVESVDSIWIDVMPF